ncbi:glucan 1,3-beta-glucosidase 2 [Thozetella sp. PMI_491]|nr:glucan 1,3-beta-glucosidase 2 [Thozetella sp. PMI_491]
MAREPERASHRRRESDQERERRHRKRKSTSRSQPSASTSENSSVGQALSIDALAQLNRQNAKNASKASAEQKTEAKRASRRERDSRPKRQSIQARDEPECRDTTTNPHYRDDRNSPEPTPLREYRVSKSRPARKERYQEVGSSDDRSAKYQERRKKKRVVSGAMMEEGREKRHLRGGAGGTSSYDSLEKEDLYEYRDSKKKRKRLWIYIGIGVAIALAIIIAVAVVVSKNNAAASDSNSQNLSGVSPSSVPAGAPTWLNPFKWTDTTDFNLTYTDVMVGDLPIMGLNSTWDDSKAANEFVPALNQDWGDYAKRPARGVNIGGWLSIEPFITPSLFNYDKSEGIVDEYTLCQHLGSGCAGTLEKHYATFVTESTFKEIADAGLDHVRIPYSYWAVQTYDSDPYLFRTSWRYLLRAIEWARKYGLRINLDLHALPGSQNGWNHSGRQGYIGWFNGSNGDLNAQRSLDLHDRLSKFFAQPRYQNIISHYGLANEPRMTFLSVPSVLNWTATAYAMVRKNGVNKAVVVFGDGFRGLDNWQGELTGYSDMALDVHQYVIFNTNQIVFNHTQKVAYACDGWTDQTLRSMDTTTGYGPTLMAEWSQADTDCAQYLTNVGWGNRWTGTLVTGNPASDITTPRCPLTNSQCSCDQANADPSKWSASYKQFLLMFAEAQMTSFEKGWGWFYWVWDTESA